MKSTGGWRLQWLRKDLSQDPVCFELCSPVYKAAARDSDSQEWGVQERRAISRSKNQSIHMQFFALQFKWEFKWTAWLPVQQQPLKPSWSPAVAESSTKERRLCSPSNDKISGEQCPSLILLEDFKMSRIITIPKSRKLWSTIQTFCIHKIS